MQLGNMLRLLLPRQVRLAAIRAFGPVVMDVSASERLPRERFFDCAFRLLSFNGIDGDYVEFGCHSAGTFAMAYHAARRYSHRARLWGFDSFAGLPDLQGPLDEHPQWGTGEMTTPLAEFHRRCHVNGVPREIYTVVQGYYNETIEKLAPEEAPVNISLAYIDCDLYSSTRSVLEFLMPRLKHGMVIALDDYYCFSATQIAGERRALLEAFMQHERWVLVPYIQYGWAGASFIVESRGLQPLRSTDLAATAGSDVPSPHWRSFNDARST
jgi:O-methyltransferase